MIRDELFSKAEQGVHDLIVIGGGINGAGVLRDAALRGLNAVLFEKDDFSSGTSSRSSKLIHGGLRYLETYDWKLVFEACRERQLLLDLAPQLVRPLQFLFPVYSGDRHGLFMASAGLWLYDILARFRNIRHPRIRLKGATLRAEPGLRPEGLKGSAAYFDAVTDDSYLTLANIRSARENGAVAFNHAEVTGFLEEGIAVTGVKVRDRFGGGTHEIRGRWIANLTGPWGDRLLTPAVPGRKPLLRLTKGTHLVIPRKRLPVSRAILMLAPQDARVSFLIPWETALLVGTTDTDFAGDPGAACATVDDVTYLLEVVNYHFPQARLRSSDILSTFAGVRPLLADPHKDPSQVSREHRILWERPGLVTMAGGKLTTYRKMAEQLLDGLIDRTPEWRGKTAPCVTKHLDLAHPMPATSASLGALVRPWLEEEPLMTLSDLLDRRLQYLFLEPDHGLRHIEEAQRILAGHYGFTAEESERQRKEYLELVHRSEAGLNRQPHSPAL